MRKRIMLALTTVGIMMHLLVQAQQPILGLQSYFEEAYWRYPNIPRGLLEAAAYSASRLTNLQPNGNSANNCNGMPARYGLFGLVENGQGYFINNLQVVCTNTGITPDQYKKDVRIQILAVAKFLSRQASMRQMDVRISTEGFAVLFDLLTEIPDDSSSINKYALALYKYDIYDHLQKGFTTPSLKRTPVKVKMEQIFPAALLRKLRSPAVKINVDRDSVQTRNSGDSDSNPIFTNNPMPGKSNVTETTDMPAADYPFAVYIKANPNNYQSGRNGTVITNVTIHTTQAGYASTISWFKNPAAAASAHYIIRSTDGQITQMVKESDMAYHVRNANGYTIGIEHEGYQEDGNKWYTDKMYRASAALVRNICKRNSIDETTCYRGPATASTNYLSIDMRIKGHQHYNGNTQTDPGKYWNWSKYADLLTNTYTPDSSAEPSFLTIPNGIYRVTNVNSNKVLNTRDCTGNQAARLTQAAWNGKECQQWRFEHAGDGWYRITSEISGRVLDLPACSKDNVQPLLNIPKNTDCQLWRLYEEGDRGELRLENKASGKVLEIFAGSANNGAAVRLNTWGGKSRQKWTVIAVSLKDREKSIANGNQFRHVQLDSTEVIPIKQ